MLETLGASLGSDDRRVKSDLERFKEMIEHRGRESGAWRGGRVRSENAATARRCLRGTAARGDQPEPAVNGSVSKCLSGTSCFCGW